MHLAPAKFSVYDAMFWLNMFLADITRSTYQLLFPKDPSGAGGYPCNHSGTIAAHQTVPHMYDRIVTNPVQEDTACYRKHLA
jgi:hypothetical protein